LVAFISTAADRMKITCSRLPLLIVLIRVKVNKIKEKEITTYARTYLAQHNGNYEVTVSLRIIAGYYFKSTICQSVSQIM
jgi:hypothetical protein